MELQQERKLDLLKHMTNQCKNMEKYHGSIAKWLKINIDDWMEKLVLEYKKMPMTFKKIFCLNKSCFNTMSLHM